MSEFLWSGLGLVAPLLARVDGLVPEGVTGVSIDSRSLAAGELFFAILGDNSDGHDYVGAAFSRGAAACVVDEAHADRLKGLGPLYIVDDTLRAMERLGRAARARTKARVIAVTGSVGKTSTKEMLRKVLGDAGKTHASAKSFNNHWGVPLTLSLLPEDAEFAVFEIGMNHRGEIEKLVDMVRPDVAIVTTVAPVHLEHFSSVEEIAAAKAEIFGGLVEGGVAILPRDIPTFPILAAAARQKAAFVLTFGEGEGADAQLTAYRGEDSFSFVEARALGEKISFRLGAPGRHMAQNALAVILAARAVGLGFAQIALSLGGVAPAQGRGAREILYLPDGGTATLIDESYNANPASMRAALDLLGATFSRNGGRKIAALGDMLELGPRGAELHAELAQHVLRNRVDLIFSAGPLSRALFEALPVEKRGGHVARAIELEPLLEKTLRDGDVLMIKGSNGSKLHALAAALKKAYAAPAQNKVEAP